MALVKPLHRGDPDVMRNSYAATCIRSDLHAYVTRNRIQPRSPIVTWGGAVATQVKWRLNTAVPMALFIEYSPAVQEVPASNPR
jgi:hypothetical protein